MQNHRYQPLDRSDPALEPSSRVSDRLETAILSLGEIRNRPTMVAVSAMALVVLASLGWWFNRPPGTNRVEAAIPSATSSTLGQSTLAQSTGSEIEGVTAGEPSTTTAPKVLLVHVVGEVKRPGIVELSADGRVVDAVEAAGGPTGLADLNRLNMAAPAGDGVQIRVPEIGSDDPGPYVVGASVAFGSANGSPADPEVLAVPVSINSAPAGELERLPGIGPALAMAIISWREENGPFVSIDRLSDVPGIGPAKLDQIRDQATL